MPRSGCYSNVKEIKPAFLFNFFIHLLTILLVSVVSLFSVVLFRFACFVSAVSFRCFDRGVLVHDLIVGSVLVVSLRLSES